MSIASIQSKYPSAIWYDSAHTGTESGTVDEPYNTITEAMTAASDGGVIAIKDGTHSTSNITLAKSLTFVGESTSAIISSTGSSYGGAFNARNTGHSIKIETLKVYHNTSTNTLGIIQAGNTASATVTVEGCILEMGPDTFSASQHRGWFTGHSSPTTSLTVTDSILTGGTTATTFGFVIGGDFTQDGFNEVTFKRNTFVITNGSADKFSSYTGIASSTFNSNIFVGNANSETLGFTPTSATNNCYHNNGISSGNGGLVFADPQFVDAPNGDYRLRPTSPCISAGTSS